MIDLRVYQETLVWLTNESDEAVTNALQGIVKKHLCHGIQNPPYTVSTQSAEDTMFGWD